VSLSDYIHPGWEDGYRRVRQIIRQIGDSKRPVGVESHEPWCGGGAIMPDGRCVACNAMRQPKVNRSEIPPIMRLPDYRTLEETKSLSHEMALKVEESRRRVEASRRRIERMSLETKQLKASLDRQTARPCRLCGAQTSNASGMCHRCKQRAEVKQKHEASHMAMDTGDGRVVSHGIQRVQIGDQPALQCKKCSAIYYDLGPCPWCQLGSKPLDSGNGT
jgi:hypothetical protein